MAQIDLPAVSVLPWPGGVSLIFVAVFSCSPFESTLWGAGFSWSRSAEAGGAAGAGCRSLGHTTQSQHSQLLAAHIHSWARCSAHPVIGERG